MTPEEEAEYANHVRRRDLEHLRVEARKRQGNDDLRAAIRAESAAGAAARRAAGLPESRWLRVGLPPMPPKRPRGRPGWTAEEAGRRLAAARAATPLPHTWARLAANFTQLDGRVPEDPDYLRKLVKRFGLE